MKCSPPFACLLMAALCVSCGDVPAAKDDVSNTAGGSSSTRRFKGGGYEASGVVQVAGTDGFLFVDDNRSSEVFWLRLNPGGGQIGPIRSIPLGVRIEDPEDIASDGQYYYIIGSQSGRKSGAKIGLVRFVFDAASGRVSSLSAVAGLREFLSENVPDLPPSAYEEGPKDGLNIEGLAWNPREGCLMLGLRSPRIGKDAGLIRLKERDRTQPFTLENLTVVGAVVPLALGGAGIRGLGYDAKGGRLLVISGPTETQNKKPFALFEWEVGVPRRLRLLESELKPEGICRLSGDQLLIVCDGSAYEVIPEP